MAALPPNGPDEEECGASDRSVAARPAIGHQFLPAPNRARAPALKLSHTWLVVAPRLHKSHALVVALTWLLCSASPAHALAPAVPHGRTPAHLLDVSGLRHHEVLRIDPGVLGPSGDYNVVVDAWTSNTNPGSVEGVQVWWLDREANDERSPFGPTVRRRITVAKTQLSPRRWTVAIVTSDDRFTFVIESDSAGRVVAYATIVEDRTTIERCQATRAELVAKRFLGVPIGLRRLDVTCVDSEGKPHHGAMQ